MQVFLPYPSFQQSVACLDKSRLGNQIWRECKTLLNGGWKHHPVAKMWSDYHHALAGYMWCGISELVRRNDITTETQLALDDYLIARFPMKPGLRVFDRHWKLPPFIGNSDFHLSHRLNLLWKAPEWYSKYFDEPVPTSKPPYLWPSPQKIGSETEPKQ